MEITIGIILYRDFDWLARNERIYVALMRYFYFGNFVANDLNNNEVLEELHFSLTNPF